MENVVKNTRTDMNREGSGIVVPEMNVVKNNRTEVENA